MSAGKKEIKIGLAGYGFMGKTHAYAVTALPFFVSPLPFTARVAGVATRSVETARAAAEGLGLPLSCAYDNEDALIASDVDVIDVCTPNICHAETVRKALAAGKHVFCEKPLADNLKDAEELAALAAASGKICTVGFNNRHFAAVTRAKQLIDEGRLGDILTFDFAYLHDSCVDPLKKAGWKQTAAVCGAGGVLFDLGSHILDLLVYLCGPVRSVIGRSQIAFPARRGPSGEDWRTDAPEAFYMFATTAGGAKGTVTASKLAAGTNDDLHFTIYGTKGALSFSLMEPNYLGFYDKTAEGAPYGGTRGFTKIECVGRYPAPAGAFPSPKAATGWLRGHVMSMYRFLNAVYEDRQNSPDFAEAAYIQRVMDAALRSDAEGREVTV